LDKNNLNIWTEHFCSIVVNWPTKCVKDPVDLLMYSRFTPTSFGKWLPSSGGRRCLRSYSSSVWTLQYTDSTTLPTSKMATICRNMLG
jgi:hypothetical protein